MCVGIYALDDGDQDKTGEWGLRCHVYVCCPSLCSGFSAVHETTTTGTATTTIRNLFPCFAAAVVVQKKEERGTGSFLTNDLPAGDYDDVDNEKERGYQATGSDVSWSTERRENEKERDETFSLSFRCENFFSSSLLANQWLER